MKVWVFFFFFLPVNVAFDEWSTWKFPYCPRLLYSAALLHMIKQHCTGLWGHWDLFFTWHLNGVLLEKAWAARFTSWLGYFYLKKIVQFCLHVVGVYAHLLFVNTKYVVNELEIVLYEGILHLFTLLFIHWINICRLSFARYCFGHLR